MMGASKAKWWVSTEGTWIARIRAMGHCFLSFGEIWGNHQNQAQPTGVPEREWLASQGQKSRIELRSFHSQLLFQSSAERNTRKWPMVKKWINEIAGCFSRWSLLGVMAQWWRILANDHFVISWMMSDQFWPRWHENNMIENNYIP